MVCVKELLCKTSTHFLIHTHCVSCSMSSAGKGHLKHALFSPDIMCISDNMAVCAL